MLFLLMLDCIMYPVNGEQERLGESWEERNIVVPDRSSRPIPNGFAKLCSEISDIEARIPERTLMYGCR